MAISRPLLSLVLASASCGVLACTGTGSLTPVGVAADAGSGADAAARADAGTAAEAARAAYDDNCSAFVTQLCASCHQGDDSIGFLRPNPDAYTTLIGWSDMLDLQDPRTSPFITKGAHAGPAFSGDQVDLLEDWLELEATAASGGGGGGSPDAGAARSGETNKFSPQVGQNSVDLSALGLTGSAITFWIDQLDGAYYVTEFEVSAGATGAHLVHPVFLLWSGTQYTADPYDRFYGVEVSASPATTKTIGGGTAVLVDVTQTTQLSIRFDALASYGGGGGSQTGACTALDQFGTWARQSLATNCVSCHGGGSASATAATDMSLLEDLTPASQATACANILSRVNLANPTDSAIFIAPDPASGTGHPFTFGGDANAFSAFRDALLVWISNEETP